MHRHSERFMELAEELKTLHMSKGEDYGSDESPLANVIASEDFGIPGWVGAVVRLHDKVVRLKSFARKGALRNESVEDSLRDIAAYALISLVLFEEAGAKPHVPKPGCASWVPNGE